MKKNIIITTFIGLLFSLSACQDMLETESNRQIFDPELDQKTDSMFYTLGILKGVQQAIDQYVLVGEMRGELTTTNTYTDNDLRELSKFSVSPDNRYDSAYVWYRIINNCNYYIAHRDTTLLTGSKKIAIPEYVQALSIRAWAYMQLAKIYGAVPFYTTPITSVSEARMAGAQVRKNLKEIVEILAPELQKWTGTPVPSYVSIDAGKTNAGRQKTVNPAKLMFPADIVLGDLYLEINEYEKAARFYWNYIRNNSLITNNLQIFVNNRFAFPNKMRVPNDMGRINLNGLWNEIFNISNPRDVITYVPMAVNRLRGVTTTLPKLFGWDYYTSNVDTTAINSGQKNYQASSQYVLERQIDPSASYFDLCNRQLYYYRPQGAAETTINSVALGDLRRYVTCNPVAVNDSSFYLMTKYQSGNINIYRHSTVYLRFAEALNRMGYPDAAFAILKDGLGAMQLQYASIVTDDEGNYLSGYLRDETKKLLTERFGFLSEEYSSVFTSTASVMTNYGLHGRGAGYVAGPYSGYDYAKVLGNKFAELISSGLMSRDERDLYGEHAINAMEDIICDEYALEFAFEGNRFGDLTRLARHKNASGYGGANFGGRWLAHKLASKHPLVDLTQESNWFLPYQ